MTITSHRPVERLRRRERVCRVPRPHPDEAGQFIVDATWGTIAPMTLAPGVRTVGELEVIEHMQAGLPLVDTRQPSAFEGGTLPGAVNIPHEDMASRMDEIDRSLPTVLFCNGPQCAATPDAVRTLLQRGHPADKILYYRGGIHDWVTLGLPLSPPI